MNERNYVEERGYYSRIRVANDDGYETETHFFGSKEEETEVLKKLRERGYVERRWFRGYEFF